MSTYDQIVRRGCRIGRRATERSSYTLSREYSGLRRCCLEIWYRQISCQHQSYLSCQYIPSHSCRSFVAGHFHCAPSIPSQSSATEQRRPFLPHSSTFPSLSTSKN